MDLIGSKVTNKKNSCLDQDLNAGLSSLEFSVLPSKPSHFFNNNLIVELYFILIYVSDLLFKTIKHTLSTYILEPKFSLKLPPLARDYRHKLKLKQKLIIILVPILQFSQQKKSAQEESRQHQH